jgi:hypothetical protein
MTILFEDRIPRFHERSAALQIPRLRSPGFPVEIGGVGELHAPFLTERRTRNRVQRSVAGNPGRDDKKERAVARRGLLLKGLPYPTTALSLGNGPLFETALSFLSSRAEPTCPGAPWRDLQFQRTFRGNVSAVLNSG